MVSWTICEGCAGVDKVPMNERDTESHVCRETNTKAIKDRIVSLSQEIQHEFFEKVSLDTLIIALKFATERELV